MVSKWRIGVALGALTAIALSTGARADEAYIPLISKGFQHQFWQAVKLGAEQSAKDNNVKITFEGPETEAMVDKQIDMLSAALAKKPTALGFAALDSKAAIPLLKKAQSAEDEKSWRVFRRQFLAEMKMPEASRDLDLLAALSHHTNFAIGCYCENEARCHRSILRELLIQRGAHIA